MCVKKKMLSKLNVMQGPHYVINTPHKLFHATFFSFLLFPLSYYCHWCCCCCWCSIYTLHIRKRKRFISNKNYNTRNKYQGISEKIQLFFTYLISPKESQFAVKFSCLSRAWKLWVQLSIGNFILKNILKQKLIWILSYTPSASFNNRKLGFHS